MKKIFYWMLSATLQAGWVPLLVFILHVVLSAVFHAYTRFPDLDIPMHLAGGIVIAFYFNHAITLSGRFHIFEVNQAPVRFLLVWGYVCAAAVFWEFAEYIFDFVLHTNMQASLKDTMGDMLNGIIGGTLFIVIKTLSERKKDNR